MKYISLCSKCGSENVQSIFWVDLNTNEIQGGAGANDIQDNWCSDCEEHIKIETKKISDE